MIPPDAQRTMSERIGATVVEVDASHSVYVSQPAAVADLSSKRQPPQRRNRNRRPTPPPFALPDQRAAQRPSAPDPDGGSGDNPEPSGHAL